jgi:tRNAThr (cytosine32-N3)-methyltransferase
LTSEADVWSQNAWDHVPPPDDQAETIAKSLSRQRLNPVPFEEKDKFNEKPAKHWYARASVSSLTLLKAYLGNGLGITSTR